MQLAFKILEHGESSKVHRKASLIFLNSGLCNPENFHPCLYIRVAALLCVFGKRRTQSCEPKERQYSLISVKSYEYFCYFELFKKNFYDVLVYWCMTSSKATLLH